MKRQLLIGLFSLLLVTACSSSKTAVKPPERFDPEKAFAAATAALEKKDYQKARTQFVEIRNRDFTRKYAPLAQLKVADSYVQEEEPELAVAEYRKFMETYPDHEYASYAQYQIATVYFNEIEGPERGYGGAAKALAEFEKLKTMYPRNPYKEVIDLKIEQCRNTIAEYEYLVGEFYYKKGSYIAALGRFEGLLAKYPGYQGEAAVLYHTGLSYRKLGKPEKAEEYLVRLIEKYPSNTLSEDAQKELADITRP
jgi:outer membrane protein assembly factor BamD